MYVLQLLIKTLWFSGCVVCLSCLQGPECPGTAGTYCCGCWTGTLTPASPSLSSSPTPGWTSSTCPTQRAWGKRCVCVFGCMRVCERQLDVLVWRAVCLLLQKDLVLKAVQKDQEGDRSAALSLYCSALEHFVPAIHCKSSMHSPVLPQSQLLSGLSSI